MTANHPRRVDVRTSLSKTLVIAAVGTLSIACPTQAHDLFIKLNSFFVSPNSEASLALLSGTFEKSENTIARDRMRDVRIVGPEAQKAVPSASQWRDADETTRLDIDSGAAGTYVAGVSTRPRMIELSAEDFNAYLEHDGVLDELEARKRDGKLAEAARERYSKHVKAVYQVGEPRTSAYREVLGYPIEILPLKNPYHLKVGDELEVRVLLHGQPLRDQLVYAGHAGHHAHDAAGRHIEAVKTRTDREGLARIEISAAGQWYVRLIHMVRLDGPDANYESKWATLTFEIR